MAPESLIPLTEPYKHPMPVTLRRGPSPTPRARGQEAPDRRCRTGVCFGVPLPSPPLSATSCTWSTRHHRGPATLDPSRSPARLLWSFAIRTETSASESPPTVPPEACPTTPRTLPGCPGFSCSVGIPEDTLLSLCLQSLSQCPAQSKGPVHESPSDPGCCSNSHCLGCLEMHFRPASRLHACSQSKVAVAVRPQGRGPPSPLGP